MYLYQTIIISVLLWSSVTADQHGNNQTKQETHHKCSLLSYSSTCLKLDLLRLMTHFGKKTNVNLLPGVTLFSTDITNDLMTEINSSAKNVTEDNIDTFLKESAIKYLGSLNITMQVGRSNILPEIELLSDEWAVSGRKRKGLYTLGTLAAFAFAMLAALTGKALMASLLALIISAFSSLRGGGGGGHGGSHDFQNSPPAFGKVTQYDIITRPIVANPYHDHDHHHYNSYIDTYTASGRTIASTDLEKDLNKESRKL